MNAPTVKNVWIIHKPTNEYHDDAWKQQQWKRRKGKI